MPTSSIGSYVFLSMSDQPRPAAQQLVAETRAGVDGVGWWKAGSKGTEYTLTTITDTASYSTAVALAATYPAAQNAGALAIVYGGVAIGNVIVVEAHGKAEAVAHGQGGFAAGGRAGGIVRGTWKVVAV